MPGFEQFDILDTKCHEEVLKDNNAAACLKFPFKINTVHLYNCELTG